MEVVPSQQPVARAATMAEPEPEGDGTGSVQLPAMKYQAAHHIVKTAEGKLGFVLRYVPGEFAGDDDEVILWFADGKQSDYIEEASLTQATPADAGYESLAQYWAEAQAKLAWRKVGAIAKSSARNAGGELGVITVMEGDDPEACGMLRFANGESRSIVLPSSPRRELPGGGSHGGPTPAPLPTDGAPPPPPPASTRVKPVVGTTSVVFASLAERSGAKVSDEDSGGRGGLADALGALLGSALGLEIGVVLAALAALGIGLALAPLLARL